MVRMTGEALHPVPWIATSGQLEMASGRLMVMALLTRRIMPRSQAEEAAP